MTYTGDVEVGGPADVRELPGLTISKLAVSEMANNAYLLRDTVSGDALLIDAADDAAALRALIGNADVRTVVTTHGHWDHHRALPEIVAATGAVTVAHAADAGDLPVPVDRTVEQGDTVTVGDTWKDPERFTSLIDDVEERLFGTLPDETWVYPGHGKDTTIGAERPHL